MSVLRSTLITYHPNVGTQHFVVLEIGTLGGILNEEMKLKMHYYLIQRQGTPCMKSIEHKTLTFYKFVAHSTPIISCRLNWGLKVKPCIKST